MDLLKANRSCSFCSLAKTAQCVNLMGRGMVPADVMLIDEAPGFREDDIGKPFAGKSGKILDLILNRANLDREKVYITNVVKCRPPNNRTPKRGEIEACRSYLDKELKVVSPKLIICLGKIALSAFLGNQVSLVDN